MIDDFMYVLENYPDANLASKSARKQIAEALANVMCEHHIVFYTNVESFKNDPKFNSWVNYCNSSKEDKDDTQMQIPFKRGL
tara:strand:- start:334 stop:579 length:246 start_codon:yes stop_codon:yes gene_type:complete